MATMERMLVAVDEQGNGLVLEWQGDVIAADVRDLGSHAVIGFWGPEAGPGWAGLAVWEGTPDVDDAGESVYEGRGAWREPTIAEWSALVRRRRVWPRARWSGAVGVA